MADFSKFRESSDLSDVVVAVEGKDYKLHKFPLYARSDYFCEMTRIKPDPEAEPLKVELPDFPGGSDIFGQVADFCYNMPLNVNKDNVVAIRSAAEYLRMSGPGNLIEASSKVLMDTISSAKINRFVSVIISMLMDCTDIGHMAEKAGVVDVCLDAFLECWVRPGVRLSTTGMSRSSFKATAHADTLSAFTRLSSHTTEQLDDVGLKCLLALKGPWFASLLKKAAARGVSYDELGSLTTKYISSFLDYEPGLPHDQPNRDLAENRTSLCPDDAVVSDNDKDAESDLKSPFDDKKPRQFIGFEAFIYQADCKIPESRVQREEIGLTLDMVINALPEQALDIPEVTMEWLTKTIQAATLHKCQCRDKLVKVAGEKLTKLDPQDLSTVSPLVLHSIVVDTSDHSDQKGPRLSRERACALVDKYLLHMTSQGDLSADDFRLLVSATLNYQRPKHDQLFEALTFVLKSDKKQLSPDQRRELIEFINFDLLTEVSLQKALEEDLVPPAKIAQSALKLCSRLRGEMASVKFIAQLQEEDVHKYSGKPVGLRQSAVPLSRHTDSVTYKHINEDTDIEDLRDGVEPTPAEVLPVSRLDSTGYIQDPLRAAQNVLAAARHRLNLPVYTGYRPTVLSRPAPPVYGDHGYLHHFYTQRELDLGLEEELDLERSFYGLDSRAARRPKPAVSGHRESGSRAYFPYTSHVHKF